MKLRPIASNMTQLGTDKFEILFSYSTPVAAYDIPNGRYYRTDHKWSRTTSKHITKWLAGAQAFERPQEWFDGLVA